MFKRADSKWIKHFDFILSDVICINISFVLAYYLRHGVSNLFVLPTYRSLMLILTLLHFTIIFFTEFYSGILRRGYFQEAINVVQHNVILCVLMFVYMFLTQITGDISRITIVAFFMINVIVMYMSRIFFKKMHHRRGTSLDGEKNLLLVASSGVAHDTIHKLKDGPDKRYKIIGIALTDDKPHESIENNMIDGIPIVADAATVFDYCRTNVVNDVFIRISNAKPLFVEGIAYGFLNMGIEVHVNIEMLSHSLPNAGFDTINNTAVVTTSIRKSSPSGLLAKRCMDVAAGIVGCFITGILYIFVAPAIKIADPKGPVFFAQERAGKNGKPFKIYKFRSMYSDAEERKAELMEQNKMDGLMFKVDADPRIIGSGKDGTKKGLGHFLRSSSIDEFPNFYSILKGDMSLVGTRPPTMDEYEQYELHHKSRLAAKPGLTGMWQISGRSDMTNFEEIVKMDNDYIMNWSFKSDVKIVLKTVWVVVMGKGSQ